MINVKIRTADIKNDSASMKLIEQWAAGRAARLAYTWRVATLGYTYGSLVVPVNQLQALILESPAHNFEIVYIHDF